MQTKLQQYANKLQSLEKELSLAIESDSPLASSISSYSVLEPKAKRFRPLLVIMIGNLLGVEEEQQICCAAIVELLHTATLLHDDVLDESYTRRQKPTVNAQWGSKLSILGGDLLLASSFKLMAKLNCLAIIQLFSDTVTKMVEGEFMQMEMLKGMKLPSQAEYMELIYKKTASLFAAGCQMPALLTLSQLSADLYEFGRLFGIAYQMHDDLHDYLGNNTGKDLGRDFFEGKATLPFILLHKMANSSEQVILRDIMNSPARDISQFKYVASLMRSYDVARQVKEEMDCFASKAATLAEKFSSSNSTKLAKLKSLITEVFALPK